MLIFTDFKQVNSRRQSQCMKTHVGRSLSCWNEESVAGSQELCLVPFLEGEREAVATTIYICQCVDDLTNIVCP